VTRPPLQNPQFAYERTSVRSLASAFGTIGPSGVSNQSVTYLVGAGCAVIVVIAFAMLVVVPAVSSYRRPLQRIAAMFLSLYVLAAFVGVGVLLGLLIIVEWPRLF